MTTRLDLPQDLVEEIQHLASQEGRNLDETVTDLLRKALASSVLPHAAGETTLEARRQLAGKFLSGEWGAELSGFEVTRAADRECAIRRDGKWRS